jgi:uncharacterized protein (TIGR00255 family)
MTGYSKSKAHENGITSIVEIKTLNGRYLEINCKLPSILSQKEMDIRTGIKTVLSRGSVVVSIKLEYDNIKSKFSFNEAKAAELSESLISLRKALKIKELPKFEHILMFSDKFIETEEPADCEKEWKVTVRALKEALKQMDTSRLREGQAINKDFLDRIKKISKSLEQIEELAENRVPAERERLRQRVAMLFDSDEIDEQRLQMELVLMANKLDVSEECVRLRSHIKYFQETMKSKDSVGQKLNFILQEMNREVNTIGSKADDADISRLVVELKEELERIREQAQNIE